MTYIALLRGVNVGGVVVKMAALRAVFEGLGYGNVRSYVQSGNVLLDAPGGLWEDQARQQQLERFTGLAATTRNGNTVRVLLELAL